MSQSNTAKEFVQVKPGVLHAGIDLALEKNVVVVINDQGERVDRFSFPQDRSGYDYFLGRLEKLCQKLQAADVVIAMEPSNYFWKLLAQELETKEIPYRLVNAYTVKKHREGDQLDRSKDDKRDAMQIAELSRNGRYTETQLQKGGYEELRQYAALHAQCLKSIQRERMILWGLVGQVFPELAQVFKVLEGETCQALLRSGAPAAFVRQKTEDAFLAQVRAAFSGKKLAVSKLRQAYSLAAGSIGLREGLQAAQLAIQLHLAYFESLQTQLQQVVQAMSHCLKTLPEAPYLLSILGESAAGIFLGNIGDPRRFRAAAQWVKLAGIQPVPDQSGKKQRSQTPMSHRGRPALRTMLYYSCLVLLQHDPRFSQLYHRLQRRPKNPLTKMQAIGVLMNKLLHVLWALVHNQTFYNPSFAQPL